MIRVAPAKCIRFALACFSAIAVVGPADAGHEISYYPSFYPQEIRIEPLKPAAAAKEFANKTDPLHAYLGGAPEFGDAPPAHLKFATSLQSFITVTVNPQSPRLKDRQARCRAVSEAVLSLRAESDIVRHAYPVTPFHPDYLDYVDLLPDAQSRATTAQNPPLAIRYSAHGRGPLLSLDAPTDAAQWDLDIGEVSVAEVLLQAGVAEGVWLPPAAVKEGWYQAYTLLRSAVGGPARGEAADAAYERLTQGTYGTEVERLNLQRGLVRALTADCERAVIGYRLRREYYSDDFSNGVENIASDSQSGFNSGVVVRALKLKDFPWNGWLRIGIDEVPEAAWNPVAGFNDAVGRLVWSTVGDAAFLPITYNGRWVQNRAEVVVDEEERKQSAMIPSSALMPEAGTGKLVPVGRGKGAMGKITYRLSASPFQDGTQMEVADLLYPFVLAYRWGESEGSGAVDPQIAATTKMLRERLSGVRVLRVDERSLQIADLTFSYRSPVVEVYLNSLSSDAEENALIAPPWSSVPWHVLALMEAAVERNIAAFSQAEAVRRSVAWLDLVRDKPQLGKLTEIVREFASTAYRPAAIEPFVSPEAATARWQALVEFVETNGHLLVTNGPYRLVSWSPQVTVLGVVREFTYPVGIGTFDRFAYPPHAIVTGVERAEGRVLVTADVEMATKVQRDHRPVRKPLKHDTLRDTLTIRPLVRYFIVGENGKVKTAGRATWQPDGRFALGLTDPPASDDDKLFAGIFLDGNTLEPSIASINLKSN
jgi:hypothetical protein